MTAIQSTERFLGNNYFPVLTKPALVGEIKHPQKSAAHFASAVGSGNKHLERTYSKETLSVHTQSLIAEIERVKQEEQKKGETAEPWYFLSGTGFFVHGQVDLFLKDIQKEMLKGKTFEDALDFSSVKIQEDVKGFEYEYLKQLAGLQWNIGWKDVEGKEKLYGVDYNGALLDDLTSRDEREGALRDAWFADKPGEGKMGIETWLRTAPVGSKVLLVSPSGWSGYEDFTYPQTQIYYVEVGEGKSLKSFTLRYDVPIEKNEQFQRSLGIMVPEVRTERERIKQMLGSPIFIAPDGTPKDAVDNRKIHSPQDVITLMEEVKGSGVAFADTAFGERTFDDMRAFIGDPERFLTRHPEAQGLIETFQEYARWEFAQNHTEEETRQGIEIALALIIVHLKGLYFGSSTQAATNEKPIQAVGSVAPTQIHMPRVQGGMFQKQGINYQQELEDIQKLPGCAGTSNNKVRINSLGGSREADSAKSGETCVKITCRQCGWQPESGEPVGSECPTCGWNPDKPVDPDWAAKKRNSEQPEKPTEPKKKPEFAPEKTIQVKRIEQKKPEVKKLDPRRDRRGGEDEQKKAA